MSFNTCQTLVPSASGLLLIDDAYNYYYRSNSTMFSLVQAPVGSYTSLGPYIENTSR